METGKVLPGALYQGGMGTPVQKHGKQLESTNRSLTFLTQRAVAFLEDEVPGARGQSHTGYSVSFLGRQEAGGAGNLLPSVTLGCDSLGTKFRMGKSSSTFPVTPEQGQASVSTTLQANTALSTLDLSFRGLAGGVTV